MRSFRCFVAASLFAALCATLHAASATASTGRAATSTSRAAPSTTSMPSTGPAVPQAVIKRLEGLMTPPGRDVSPDKAAAKMQVSLLAVLQLGEEAESNYPSAPNLYEVRARMLEAAIGLYRINSQRMYRKEAINISHRILGSPAPMEITLGADRFITGDIIADGKLDANESAAEIRKFAARYADSNAASMALAHAAILADQSQLTDLTDELVDQMIRKYGAANPVTRAALDYLGRNPDIVGKPFETTLTRLDGTKLNLPRDLLGKVVVIDFWATWCGPCVAEMPHMKEVYAKYASKGVEFVGISSDLDKDAPAKFVKENDIKWIQTFDPGSPASRKYGVEYIPSVWVVGKDGRIVAYDVRQGLERVLDKSLAATATMPAAAATTPATAAK
jgi:thiol-disulfide isomerase/thioredoxin